MSQQQLLKRVVAELERLSIEYMVTGSHASSLQGAPRSTHDVDFVIAMPGSATVDLARAFPPPEFYLDEQSIRDALNGLGQFNLIHVNEGDKVGFWLLTDDPYDQVRFDRRRVVTIDGMAVAVSTPEDTILQKLRWATTGGGFSEKQFKDALSVYELQSRQLDIAYMDRWAPKIGVTEHWNRLKAEARPL